MNNPWFDLPEQDPFVLACDQSLIQTFNDQTDDLHFIPLELLPEPFLGKPQAKVILLNLNPGFSEKDIFSHSDNPYFRETSRANLTHTPLDYPFYLLDPQNASSSGSLWWRTKLKSLIQRYGLKQLANELCVVEYFPYHSAKFSFRQNIPSQSYSFYLVEEAIKRQALIIQMRSQAAWQMAVPGLKDYQHIYTLRSTQNVAISERNCPDGYPEILRVFGRSF